MNTGADEMWGSSDCYHQNHAGTNASERATRYRRRKDRNKSNEEWREGTMLHGNVGTCMTGSRIKRVTFYIPALQKVFAKRLQRSMHSLYNHMFVKPVKV